MYRPARLTPPLRLLALAVVVLLGSYVSGASGQEATGTAPRQFAPGVLTTIPPNFDPQDAVSTHDLIEVRDDPNVRWQPELLSESRTLYGMSEAVKFRRDVWCLEFSFKPLRMIHVDVPQSSGKMQRKLIWYMVYKVKNTGQVLVPHEEPDGTFTTTMGAGGPVRFIPKFVLQAHDLTSSGKPIHKEYLDSVIPVAKELIQKRELPGVELLNSVEMSEREIPPSDGRTDRGLWGLVTWEGVDPRIDFFSVYVGGLTNAYRWVDLPNAYRPGDPAATGRQFVRKTLQLNFWRPGDELAQHEGEIRFGVPTGKANLYGVPAGVASRWVYR